MPARPRPYHHGDLGNALLRAAVEVISEDGPAAMSVRGVARRAGVTHAAATYHFGDKAGLLTAVAAEGYRLLADALRAVPGGPDAFLEMGVAYVRFAATRRAHFAVMFRPELYRPDDADLLAARTTTAALLYGEGDRGVEAGVAAWSLVHGVATLWLDGNLPAALGDDPEAIARRVITSFWQR